MDATTHTVTQTAKPGTAGLRAQASDVRRRARLTLDGHTAAGNRMTLILSLIIVMTVAVGLYIVSSGVYMVGYMLVGEAVWLDMAAYGLMGLLALFVALPLAVAAWRQACLMTARADTSAAPHDLPVTSVRPTPDQLFYPFTSLRAYGRTLAVGLESLGWAMLSVGIPAIGYRIAASVFAYWANRGVLAQLCDALTAVSLLLCIAFGVLMFFLSGLRAGFGYFVFVHDSLSLGEVNRYFRGSRRGSRLPFLWRMSLLGWVALSVVGILVPFILHTIPYGMCCAASYARTLKRK